MGFNGIKEKSRFKDTDAAQSMPHTRGCALDLAKDDQQSSAFYVFLSVGIIQVDPLLFTGEYDSREG